MKIAIFSDCYLDLTGGIVSSINAQKKALEDKGYEICVFSTAYPKSPAELARLAERKVFVVPSCRWLIRGVTPVSRRPRIIEKWLIKEHPELKEYDMFYVHYEAGCSIAALRLARKLGVPSVQVMHGREDAGEEMIIPLGLRTLVAGALDWFHSWYLPHPVKIRRDDYLATTIARTKMWELMVNHANYADKVVIPSEHFRQKLLHYGVTKPIYVVPNGYPDDKFPAEVKVKELKPGETLKIIWHSRVQGEKRIMPFLDALRLVDGKWRLDVYGGGAELGRAKKYAKRHKLPVKFYGDVKFDRLQKAIEQADLDVLVSYNYDTFGMTLIEAEAYGVPVLICDPELREVVPEGGYVLASGPEPEAMAEALSELLAHPERIAEMSRVMVRHRKEVLVSRRIERLGEIRI